MVVSLRKIFIVLFIAIFLLGGIGEFALAQGNLTTILRVAPSNQEIGLGKTVDIALEVANAQDVFGVDIALEYNPSFVEIIDLDPDQEGVQVALGSFLDPGFVILNVVDPAQGRIQFALTQLSPSLPKSGGGAVIVFRVRGKQTGISPITLIAGKLAHPDGTVITPVLESGQVIVSAISSQPTNTTIPTQAAGTTMPTGTIADPAVTAIPTITPSPTVVLAFEPPTETASPVAVEQYEQATLTPHPPTEVSTATASPVRVTTEDVIQIPIATLPSGVDTQSNDLAAETSLKMFIPGIAKNAGQIAPLLVQDSQAIQTAPTDEELTQSPLVTMQPTVTEIGLSDQNAQPVIPASEIENRTSSSMIVWLAGLLLLLLGVIIVILLIRWRNKPR